VALERPLIAEQLLASVIQATESEALLKTAAAADKDAKPEPESSDETAAAAEDSKIPTLAELEAGFAGAFANEAREPEGEFKATVKGALFWRNSDLVQKLLSRRPGNLMDRLLKTQKSAPLIEELYLSVLSRHPSDEERSIMTAFLESPDTDRETAVRDAAWALLTSIEFYVNH
jgi:hypothetical protein